MGQIAALPFQNRANKSVQTGFYQAQGTLNSTKKEATGYLNPYAQAGQSALSPLTGLLTGNQYDPATGKTTTLSPEQRSALLYQSPGYQFAQEQGQQALERSQASRGGLLSGGAQKELAQYNSGLNAQYSDNYINQLASLAGIGQSAATNQANIVSGIGTNYANSQAQAGLAKGFGIAATGKLVGDGINAAIGAYGGGAAGGASGAAAGGAGASGAGGGSTPIGNTMW